MAAGSRAKTPQEATISGLFSKPKLPTPEAPKPLPREDDEAARRARIREYAKMAQGSGRESTRLSGGEARLGDYQVNAPMTRGSAVLGG